jgi:S-adenosylmethionine synthetase
MHVWRKILEVELHVVICFFFCDGVLFLESGCKSNWAVVFGEISTSAKLDFVELVRNVYREVGYDDASVGADYRTLNVESHIVEQSQNINAAVDKSEREDDTGAGDQGLMIGFATNESEEAIPLTILYSNRLAQRLTEVRKNKTLPWLRPDGKTQVTIGYKIVGRVPVPVYVNTICVSTMHAPDVSNEVIREGIIKHVIKPVIPETYFREDTRIIINPSGKFMYGIFSFHFFFFFFLID